MTKTTPSLYDSSTKILLSPGVSDVECRRRLGDLDGVMLFKLGVGADGGLCATDPSGAGHTLNAPASGAVVIVAQGDHDSPLMHDVAALWTRAEFEPPPIVGLGDGDDGGFAANVCATLMSQLHQELRQTASDAVRLDRQIFALREELEGCRTIISETNIANRLAGDLPVMAFERLPNNTFWDMGEQPEGAQLLPYSGHLIRAVAFAVDTPSALGAGRLNASLVAREDDAVLARWEIENANADPWVILAVKDQIHARYRYVDLVLEWEGADGDAPRIGLSQVTGDREAFLRTSDAENEREMLALRVWTGAPLLGEDYARYVVLPSEAERLADPRPAVKVPAHRLAKVRAAVQRRFEWEWLRAENSDLFLHPTLEGPSIAAVDLRWTSAVRGLSTLLSNPNAKAPQIAFGLVAARDVVSAETLEHIVNGEDAEGAEDADAVIARQAWTVVPPGTVRPLELAFPEPEDGFKGYFLTKVAGDDVSFAHAWFRNIKYIV